MLDIKDKVFDIVKQATIFCNEYLVERDGYYMICPSTSPEAAFTHYLIQVGVSVATAFDMSIVKQLFINYLELDHESKFAEEINRKLEKLYPIQEGKLGVAEFYNDKQIADLGHRHFSPLYCLYPGNLVTYYGNQKELDLCKRFFDSRISHQKQHIGWSAAWTICLASRLHNKQVNEDVIYSLFANSVFSNLFDAHFPSIFQIDGNFGFVAGMNEMLVYVENDTLELLPALINNIQTGKLSGYIYNGIKIDFEWKDGLVTKVNSSGDIKLLNIRLAKDITLSKNIKIVEEI